MFVNNSFGKNLDILHRTMDVSMLRRSVIADNIANADTPNFKRSVVNFESELKRALDTEKKGGMEAALTNDRHIPFNRTSDYRDVGPKRILDYLSTTDNNGNNVDIEEESMMLLQNQLNYDMMTRIVSNQFSQINLVLR
ncbi:MAG: flagellar basal body rod protein FlgB [Spirochaetales bacterium]|jgi:flagellar basal-body rod protein FlgB|nr:flagellar basal body rod protein FlgB [Spirochaetales bacterium]